MSDSSPAADRRALLQNALQAINDLQAKLDAAEYARTEPIAIVGLSCRFPGGANDPEAYWQLLREGRDAIREYPAERWPNGQPASAARWHGGFLEQIDQFEPQFFGISPREATTMDPQQRLALEVSWEALERAGIPPETLADSQTGVFMGITTNDYARLVMNVDPDDMDVYTATGSALNVAAGRVAYVLGLHGPTMAIDTACSSSLVAIHLACQSLRNHECDVALAGGVNAILNPEAFLVFNKWGMMAPDGRCKTFDVSADGFVRSEGCGVLALKRLSDAQAAQDNILALVRGSAVNEDGKSSGLTVPNGLAQQAVIRSALKAAGLAPAQIGYVETHGTGTALGDPIEVEALGAVLGEGRTAAQPLTIGSVKTNIGHLESASGVAGLIKTVLALQHNELPPHLHLHERSPRIPWPAFPIHIPVEPTPWPAAAEPRRAGVSSFGFSGVNAHIVLEEAPRAVAPLAEVERPLHLLTLSAKSEKALQQYAQKMAAQLSTASLVSLTDAAHTLNTGRQHFPHRLAVTAATAPEAAEALVAFASGQPSPALVYGQAIAKDRPRVAFLFTGQGAQYAGMGRQLYETQPAFRAILNQCDEILRPLLSQSLLSILYPPTPEAQTLIDHTAFTQPALFALEYALAQLWRGWGVEPHWVLGHSVGEYVAACVAGAFSLEDGLKLIAARGRLMGALPTGGQMAAVFASAARVEAAVAPFAARVSIGAHNGPENIVISGAGEAVQEILAQLAAEGIKARPLTVSHAFHSPLMEPMLDEFERTATGLRLTAPRLPLISNLTGQRADDEITRAAYWRQHVRQPVRFAESLQTLHALGCTALVEIGPNPTLLSMGQRCWPEGAPALWLPSLRKGHSDWAALLASLGALHVRGQSINWQAFDAPYPRRRLMLPTYPFQRERHWVKTRARTEAAGAPRQYLTGPTRLPRSADLMFNARLSATAPDFVGDHRIYGTIIFPGTGYLSLVLEAARALGHSASRITEFAISEALVVEDSAAVIAQVVLQPQAGQRAACEIFSVAENDAPLSMGAEEWKQHARGFVEPVDAPSPQHVDVEARRAQCSVALDVAAYYRQLAELGLDYGPRFRGLQQLWHAEAGGAALGQVALPAEVEAEQAAYLIHPGVLDACFQIIGAALPASSAEGVIYMPVGLDELVWWRPFRPSGYCHIQLRPSPAAAPEVLTADLVLFDAAGEISAQLNGLRIQRASRTALERAARPRLASWFYELTWRPMDYSPVPPARSSGHWLVLAGPDPVGALVAAELRERGLECTVLTPSPDFTEDETARVLKAAPALTGIVYLWGLEADDQHPLAAQQQNCGGLLALVKGLEKTQQTPRLWIVTRQAQPAGDGHRPLAVAQAPLWGLGRTLAHEGPQWWGGLIDLDWHTDALMVSALVNQLVTPDGEDQVAYRHAMGGPLQRFVARLTRLALPAESTPLPHVGEAIPAPAHTPLELAISQSGTLDGIALRPADRVPPGPGEVEVQVFASGLNFRDVLNVLGMYPGEIPLGNECTGIVTAVGAGVTGIGVGDSVVALGAGALRSYLTTRAELVFPKPKRLSFAEAATLPTAFLTAWYGLHYLANLQAGQRVLIHAAAGGVGLAAVRLAQRLGAEVFATAGSETKRRYLRAIGVQHIYNSRHADFSDALRRATRGHGVDVVLNSLSGDFIPMSLAALAPGGYFLEIGKRGIWPAEQVAEQFPQARYHVYDLASEMQSDPATLQTALRDILAALETGHLAALPATVFPVQTSSQAFRYMAQARHIGRIALTHELPKAVRPDATYLITGGAGGLGLEIAKHLAASGAGALVLVNRSAPSEAAAQTLAQLEAQGTRVCAWQADVAVESEVATLLRRIEQELPPLKGVIHAAGLTDDALLTHHDWPRFERVLAPKVAGAWNLHVLTQHHPLDFFVLFAAGAGVFGSAGQGPYAAANAFLDALAFHRRALGLPSLSIDWGAWAEVGLAARLGEVHAARWLALGMQTISPEQGRLAFQRLLAASAPQAAVLPIRWDKLQAALGEAIPPLLRELITTAPPREAAAPARPAAAQTDWRGLPPAEQRHRLEALARAHITGVLGLPASQAIDPHQPLTDLGLDSLMAVEFSNRLRVSLGRPLPSTLVFEYRTLDALVNYLHTEVVPLLTESATPPAADIPRPTPVADLEDPAQLLQNIHQLSDAEVERLLRSLDDEKPTHD